MIENRHSVDWRDRCSGAKCKRRVQLAKCTAVALDQLDHACTAHEPAHLAQRLGDRLKLDQPAFVRIAIDEGEPSQLHLLFGLAKKARFADAAHAANQRRHCLGARATLAESLAHEAQHCLEVLLAAYKATRRDVAVASVFGL